MISELRTVPGHIVHTEHAVWQPTVIVQSHLLSCTNVVLQKIGVSGVSAGMTERTARELEQEGDRTRSRTRRGSRSGGGGALAPGDCGRDYDCACGCRCDCVCDRHHGRARCAPVHGVFRLTVVLAIATSCVWSSR